MLLLWVSIISVLNSLFLLVSSIVIPLFKEKLFGGKLIKVISFNKIFSLKYFLWRNPPNEQKTKNNPQKVFTY